MRYAAVLIGLMLIGCAGVHSVNSDRNAGGRTYVVAQRHRQASDAGPGTERQPFKTISKAAALAGPGDTVLIHAGLYREWVAPPRGGEEGRPVTYQAAPGEQVIVRGSEIYTGQWKPVSDRPGVFSTQIPESFFTAGFNPFKQIIEAARGGGRQGQIFINGVELTECHDVVRSGRRATTRTFESRGIDTMYQQPASWATDDGDTIYIHVPATAKPFDQCQIEISVRRHGFVPLRRAQNYIILRGFTFEHCANGTAFPQMGMVSCRSGQHWIIENNTIRFAKTVGLDCGAEAEFDRDIWLLPDTVDEDRFRVGGHRDTWGLPDRRIAGRHLILNNIVTDNGQCGIAGLFSDGTVVKGNIIARNARVIPGYESGGIKIHGLTGGIVEGNLVRDNDSWGIWLDCGYMGSRVTRNVVLNNAPSGIFFELSEGPGWIDNNIVAYNRGQGIYTHDAHGVVVAHNLIFSNETFGVYMHIATNRSTSAYHYLTGRERIQGGTSWERVYNNIIIDNPAGALSFPLPSPRVHDNRADYNLYGGAQDQSPLFVVNANNGLSGGTAAISEAAREAFERTGDPGLSQHDMSVWQERGVSMNLAQWQAVTSNDRNSITGKVKATLDQETFKLVIESDDSLQRLHCPPVPPYDIRDFAKYQRRIDKDYVGNPLPGGDLLPGALQNVKPGRTQIKVWPVAFDRPEVPPRISPAPAADARDMGAIPKPPPPQPVAPGTTQPATVPAQ